VLPRDYRLHSSIQIRNVLARGRAVREGPFTIKFMVTQSAHPRFAFVVPSGVSKKATDRNRVRRRASAVVERGIKEGRIAPVEAVVLAYKGASEMAFADTQVLLMKLFTRGGFVGLEKRA